MPPKKVQPAITDSEQAKDLLLWARKHRIAVSSVQVGKVALVVIDLAIPDDATKPRKDPEPRQSLIQQYGGALLEQATNGVETVEPTEEDDDD